MRAAAAATVMAALHVPGVAFAATDPVIAAAGNIACDPSAPAFNGGTGTSQACQQMATSNLLVGKGYAAVLPLGDNQYESGTSAQYSAGYDPSWGRVKAITRPVPGNHDYQTAGAAGYYGYFGSAAADPSQGYYSYDVGSWHLVALNSNCSNVTGGCAPGSPQETWLRQDLAAHQNACVLAYWHHPRFSSGEDGDNAVTSTFWQDLYNAGAEIVLSGHAHEYERFAPQTADGVVDTGYGLTEFVDGTGGESFEPAAARSANSVVLKDGVFGVLQLTLHASSADYSFVDVAGAFSDSGTVACHGAPPVTSPAAPTRVDATRGDGQATVSWAAPSGPISSYTVTAAPGGAQVQVSGTQPTAVVTGLTDGTSYTFTVTATNTAGTSPPSAPSPPTTPAAAPTGGDYVSQVLRDAPAAYWRLDEATISGGANDTSGNGRAGAYAGGVTVGQAAAVATGTAASFDGSTGQMSAPDATPLRLNGPFTVEFWARMPGFANSWPGLLHKGAAGGADGYLVWYASNGTLHFKRDNLDVATPSGALTSSFRHFAVVNDGGTTTWYVNGARVSSGPMSLPTNAGTSPVVLGQGDQPGREVLDEVALYNSALSATRVTAHYNAATVTGPTAPTVPAAPSGVSAVAGDATATVSWSPPSSDGGSAITSYTVRASNGTMVTVDGSTLSATVAGLANGTTYTFTVSATNAVGTGPASPASNAVTPRAAPTAPAAPTGVTAQAGNASATVRWSAPSSDGGSPITGYTVSASDGTKVAAGATATSATVTGLSNGTSYTFTVSATNAVGTSPESAPSQPVTPTTPTSSSTYPTAVLADGPLGYWRLGESSGTTATDGGSSGRNGSYSGGVALGQPGALTSDTDTAVAFDGKTGCMTVPDDPQLRLNGAFTIEFWAKESAFVNKWPGLIVKGSSSTANGYLIWYSSNGALHFKRNNLDVATPPGSVSTSSWHSFAVTYDGTVVRWYADGQQVASKKATFPASSGTDPLQIGRGDQFGNEMMDEVAVYATALPATRVATHYGAATT